MLLIDDARLDDRRAAARGALAPLFQSLAADLEPLLGADLHIPRDKALLTRAGGRCEGCLTPLEFDPFEPHIHRCATCGASYSGELHYRAWITWYQLWLAERAVHGALFHALQNNERHAALARSILRAYADVYLTYPNRDNVLGPTRPFFSTYLESIWLLQLCVAANLLEHAGDRSTADIVRDRVVEPSRALIADFDEAMSNRQVWNNAALLASGLLLGDARAVDERIHGRTGVLAHLSRALFADGTWYEGDNYHQFAVRGLWYAVVLLEANHASIPDPLAERLQRAFATPFLSALPDFTLPSRKDSQYAVSLRQWRYAELAELGYARRADDELSASLARCYESGHPRRDTGRSRSAADAERNVASSLLTRADLGWRALLHARETPPPFPAVPLRSVHLSQQGFAIFRRSDDVYVGFDYGQSGGGHGHPDRLNLMLAHGDTRWLDDLGTASYVDPSLQWYRSSLAHNAPLVDGRSQASRGGRLLAYDERDTVGWARGVVMLGDTRVLRTVVVAEDYLVDELTWTAPTEKRVDLPWHLDAESAGPWEPAELQGGPAAEDGFAFLRDVSARGVPAGEPLRLTAGRDGRLCQATLVADVDALVFRALAPGQPPATTRPFYMIEARGSQGRLRAVLAWRSAPTVRFGPDAVALEVVPGVEHIHRPLNEGWQIEIRARGAAPVTVELGGLSVEPAGPEPEEALTGERDARVTLRPMPLADPWPVELPGAATPGMLTLDLGEANYRRSEQSWRAAGEPRATLTLAATARGLVLHARIRAHAQRFVGADAANPFDNEPPDTLGAGIQLYCRTERGRSAWMLVPEPGSEHVRVRRIAAGADLADPIARWRPTASGYDVRVDLALPRHAGTPRHADIDVVINDAIEGSQRRRGQLVSRRVSGEFAYLRGDREEPGGSIRLEIAP